MICDEGVTAGTCGGGKENEARGGPCLDPGLERPLPTSSTYWIGGFRLQWRVFNTVVRPNSCDEIHNVELIFDDSFDPGTGLQELSLKTFFWAASKWKDCRNCGLTGKNSETCCIILV